MRNYKEIYNKHRCKQCKARYFAPGLPVKKKLHACTRSFMDKISQQWNTKDNHEKIPESNSPGVSKKQPYTQCQAGYGREDYSANCFYQVFQRW